MRYPSSEKAEIILVEHSALPINRTLEKLGIPRATFYRWYDLYQSGGPEALDDRSPRPDRVWNRIPDDIQLRCTLVWIPAWMWLTLISVGLRAARLAKGFTVAGVNRPA
jgi:transposase-like protein